MVTAPVSSNESLIWYHTSNTAKNIFELRETVEQWFMQIILTCKHKSYLLQDNPRITCTHQPETITNITILAT